MCNLLILLLNFSVLYPFAQYYHSQSSLFSKMSIRATRFRFSEMDEEVEEDNCEWVMLFCDLSIVVVLYKVSLALHSCSLSRDNFIAVFVLLFNVFAMRHSFEEYNNRLKQFPLRIIPYFVYGWGSFMMALNAFAFKVSPAAATCDYTKYSEITTCILQNPQATSLIDICTIEYTGQNISNYCVGNAIQEIDYYRASATASATAGSATIFP